MANIFPDTPPRIGTSEVIKVFNALKKLSNEYYIWHNMNLQKQNAPDFLVLRDGRVLLVMVSSSSARDARFAGQLTLMESDQVPLGKLETETLTTFIESLDLADGLNIQTLVVFPNISDEQLQKSPAPIRPFKAHWVGREVMQQESSIYWEDFLASTTPLDELSLEKLRQRFTPEVVVHAEMTVRPPIQRRMEAGLTDYLLD